MHHNNVSTVYGLLCYYSLSIAIKIISYVQNQKLAHILIVH